MATDEFTRRRNRREIERILKSVEGKPMRHASPKQYEPCPVCRSVEHIFGYWQGSVLVLTCCKCKQTGVRQSRRPGRTA